MSIPELSHEEFDALVKDMGDWGDVALEADFLIAYTGDVEEVLAPEEKTMAMRTVFMQVREPHLYRSREGKTIIVLPPEDAVTYQMINSFHPVPERSTEAHANYWLYVIKPYAGAPWELCRIMFRDGTGYEDGGNVIPSYDLNRPETH